jgi:hypothetical protein
MAIDKVKLVEKLKNATPEERALFREAVLEVEPPNSSEVLSGEEILSVREILSTWKEKAEKGKKKKGFLDSLDEFFGTGKE